MRLSKRHTKMMTKSMFPYIYVVLLISSLDLIAQCQCSQSANTVKSASENRNDDNNNNNNKNGQEQSRKLADNVEVITTYTNLISQDNSDIIFDESKDFQYFNDPLSVSTAKYDNPIARNEVPSNHKAIHPLDLNHSYLPLVEHSSYVPNEAYIQQPPIPPVPTIATIPSPLVPSGRPVSNQLVKVTREPFWAPEVYNLENQYFATFRSIKSSVMGMVYKVQSFINYVVNFFNFNENSPFEARFEGRKKKLKIKKKFKKFLLPLLIAYKLKFFTLIPILIGGLVLLVGSTGTAGFFFALFTAVMCLKGGH